MKKFLVEHFTLFSHNRDLLNSDAYVVNSEVSTDVFSEFMNCVQGEPITITPDNCQPLALVSDELGFASLAADCAAFISRQPESESTSVDARFSMIKEELLRHESRQLLTLAEIRSFDTRLSSLEKSVTALQELFAAEQEYRRGQEIIHGEHGFEKSITYGLALLKSSADHNHSDASYIYGKRQGDGPIPDRNYAESAKYLERSASQGNTFGAVGFGLLLHRGKGVAKCVDRGFSYIRRSSDAGNALGQAWLGRLIYNGEGVPKDYAEAIRYTRLAVSQGSAMGQAGLGLALSEGKGLPQNLVEATRYFKIAADQGNSYGQNNYGCSLRDGKGVTQNYAEAARYFKMSADQGNLLGLTSYGYALKEGAGVEKNYAEGVQCFKIAADEGHSFGQFLYAVALREGGKIKKDPAEAAKYMKLAADQGLGTAQKMFGEALRDGIGVRKDPVLSAHYLAMAAAQGVR
jgi:TPR repeat protein